MTCWASRSITIDLRLTEVEMRCTLAHEVARVHLAPGQCEGAVSELAARRLISDADLVMAMDCPELAARRLFVDDLTLRVRLESLTDAERAYLGVDRALLPER